MWNTIKLCVCAGKFDSYPKESNCVRKIDVIKTKIFKKENCNNTQTVSV